MNNLTKSPEAIALLEEKLHVNCHYGPWFTARALLRECWKSDPKVIRDTTFDLRDLPFNDAARDISWRRELTPGMIGQYVHHYDKNSQYLAADRSVYTGIGDPVHCEGPVTPGRPGIYRVANVSVYEGSRFDGKYFPKIIEDGQEWGTNDLLLFARKNGWEFEITEAWIFEDYKRVLDRWALTLWDARSALRGINDEAYDFIKLVAVVGNGGWAASAEKTQAQAWRETGWEMIHPNWWADTVGQARVALLANLSKYGSPILVETDGLYFVSRDGNPRSAIPGILDRSQELGGYKYESSCQITEELYNSSQNRGVGELAHLFKIAGGERE